MLHDWDVPRFPEQHQVPGQHKLPSFWHRGIRAIISQLITLSYLSLSFPFFSFLLFILPCINRDNTSDAFPPLLLRPRGTVVGLWMCARERESKLFSFISFPFHIIAPHAAS